MAARTRNRTRRTVIGGSFVDTVGASTSGYTGQSDQESNSDTTMSRPYVVDHTLVVTRRRAEPILRFDGILPHYPGWPPTPYRTYTGYNPSNRSAYTACPTVIGVDGSYWKTKALANLNPYRPHVDIPLFVYELKDLPRMVQHAGWLLKGINNPRYRHHWKDAGSVYLAYQFGWKALVSDLFAMFDFTAKIEERKTYLRSLESGTHLKRTLYNQVVSDSVTGQYGLTLVGRSVYTANIRTVDNLRVWFTANAKLVDSLPGDALGLQTLSRDIVTGMRFDPERLWDFVPWTWLSDYFVNIGDYLEAHGTLARTTVTRMNVMSTRKQSTELVPFHIESGLSASASRMLTTSKRRFVYPNPTPSISLTPFITNGQMSIIAALYATRSKRAIRVG